MSKYDNFETFMTNVIETADHRCRRLYGKELTKAYGVSTNVYSMLLIIISKGWLLFLALVALLTLGPIAFAVALIGFTASPFGVVIVVALGVFGGVSAIRILYQNRILPIAIKETGEYFKNEFSSHINEHSYIDLLIETAAEQLLKKALYKTDLFVKNMR